MELKDQNRAGIGRRAQLVTPFYEYVRLTIPAREALQSAQAIVESQGACAQSGAALYTVQLDPSQPVPKDIIAARITGTSHLGLRLRTEPAYPNELATFWEQLDFTGCPKCGCPLIWWEAGYVPGYRVCSGPAHHHFLAK